MAGNMNPIQPWSTLKVLVCFALGGVTVSNSFALTPPGAETAFFGPKAALTDGAPADSDRSKLMQVPIPRNQRDGTSAVLDSG